MDILAMVLGKSISNSNLVTATLAINPESSRNLPFGVLPLLNLSQALRPVKVNLNKEDNFRYFPPQVVGEYLEFGFQIPSDCWIDSLSGLVYFKLCGRSFGPSSSWADFANDALEDLFFKLYDNLQILSQKRNPATKTNASTDWGNSCQLILPFDPTSKFVIYTGCFAF